MGDSEKPRISSLEKFVRDYYEAGKVWVDAKLRADQLEEDCKPYLASIENALDDGEKTEAKLEREAKGSKDFRDYVNRMVIARAEALRKKIRFEALGMLFEAKRSQKAFERETIKKGIFDQGGPI